MEINNLQPDDTAVVRPWSEPMVYDDILSRLDYIQVLLEAKSPRGQAEILAAVAKIDSATSKLAIIVRTSVEALTKTQNDNDELVQELRVAGVSQVLLDKALAISGKVSFIRNQADGIVPVLQSIASKGILNPVPVDVPQNLPLPVRPIPVSRPVVLPAVEPRVEVIQDYQAPVELQPRVLAPYEPAGE